MAKDAKQYPYDEQDPALQEYQRTDSANDPSMDSLEALLEYVSQNMTCVFDDSSSAQVSHDGVDAACASEKRRNDANAEGYIAEVRRHVREFKRQ